MSGRASIPYNLPELLKASRVVIVPDLRQAKILENYGVAVTTSMDTFNGWEYGFSQFFRASKRVPAKKVYILCDHRTVLKDAEKIFHGLFGKTEWVQIIQEQDNLEDVLISLKNSANVFKYLAEKERNLNPVDRIKARKNTLSDLGNAELFVQIHGEKVRWVDHWGQWIIHTGTHWGRVEKGELRELLKDTLEKLWDRARDTQPGKEQDEMIQWAHYSRSKASINGLTDLIKDEGLRISSNELDVDKHLINFENGTLDLDSNILLSQWPAVAGNSLRSHCPDDLITRKLNFSYNWKFSCPNWQTFLDSSIPDKSLQKYIQKFIGYCLTGYLEYEMILFLHGGGHNGKSIFLQVVMQLLGEYACDTPTNTLMASSGEGIPNDLARLQGKRLVTFAETGEGKYWDEEKLKKMTGGDPITARFLHREFFSFYANFKLLGTGNHRPNIRTLDYAIRRRIKLIPFNQYIEKPNTDYKNPEFWELELPGIFNWAFKGYWMLRREGWQEPEIVKEETKLYFDEQDIFGQFLEDCCHYDPERLDTRLVAENSKLYQVYTQYADKLGHSALKHRSFSQKLMDRGFNKGKDSRGRIWKGLELLKSYQ
jgi:putative DNA primase/helicase